MTLYAILEAIQAAGAAQVQQIEKQAFVQCNEILANTRLEALRVKADAQTIAVSPAFKERARIIQRARLEALQFLGHTREEFVVSALTQIHTHLAGTRKEKNYPEILQCILEETLTALKGSLTSSGTIQIEADERDRAVLESVIHKMGLELTIKYKLNCWGGLNAKSEDERVLAINTLEARLERATPYLRRYLSALFEDQASKRDVIQVDEVHLAPT